MSDDREDVEYDSRPGGGFASTQWSLVARAGKGDNQEARAALESLCRRYWQPLYAYVRRRGADEHEAQDVTQAFFAYLLEKNLMAKADPKRGRFRTFLLASITNLMANERVRVLALKRGGGRKHLSLDYTNAESQFRIVPAHVVTPEQVFDRQWALTLLDVAMTRLRHEYEQSKKEWQFKLFHRRLTSSKESSYVELAQELCLSEAAVRQAVHRLRKRFRELLREEVANTVAEPGEVDDEIRSLFEVLGR